MYLVNFVDNSIILEDDEWTTCLFLLKMGVVFLTERLEGATILFVRAAILLKFFKHCVTF